MNKSAAQALNRNARQAARNTTMASSSSNNPPAKMPDIGKSIATALQVVPVLRGSNFDNCKARYGDVANMLKWHAELLDLDPDAGPYDFANESELQGIHRSIAWQVIVKTLAEQSDIIEGQETEGKRNARDAYRAVVSSCGRCKISKFTTCPQFMFTPSPSRTWCV